MKPLVTVAALFGTVLFLAEANSTFAAQLALTSQVVSPGSSVEVPVNFLAQGASVSGIQFDVQFANSILSLSATPGDAANNAGKQLDSNSVAANTEQYVVIGINQTVIADGIVVNLIVNISANAESGVYVLNLANATGTDPFGQPIAIRATSGTITVQTGSGFQASGLVNAASWLAGPVAPGEIITLMGLAIGPTSPQQPSGSATSKTLGGTSLLFDGNPAPLLYAGPNQINAVVPYEVSGNAVTQVQVQSGQTLSQAVPVQVTAAVPAIFTLNLSGVGQGAILNQDYTVNSASNPATVGSVVMIYATGAGQTSPAGVDGQVTGSALSYPLLTPVSVNIGGINSAVLYAGSAPGLISGALQVNAMIPAGVPSGSSVPVLLTIGEATSPAGVTIAIK